MASIEVIAWVCFFDVKKKHKLIENCEQAEYYRKYLMQKTGKFIIFDNLIKFVKNYPMRFTVVRFEF